MDDLTAKMGFDGRDFDRGLHASTAKAKAAGAEMSSGFLAPFKNAVSSMGASLLGLFGTGAIVAAFRKTSEFASKIGDLATATGISTDKLQEMDFAARQNGATLDDLAKAAKNLAKARAEALAEPGGSKARLFERFGITREELVRLDDAGALLYRLSAALKGTTVDASNLPQILQLIGEKGQAAIPALIEGLEDLGNKARELGLIMDAGAIAKLKELGDKWEVLATRTRAAMAPVFTWMIDQIEAFQQQAEIAFTGLFAFMRKFKDDIKDKGVPTTPIQLVDRAGKAFGAMGESILQTQIEIAMGKLFGAINAPPKPKPAEDDPEDAEAEKIHGQTKAIRARMAFDAMPPDKQRALLAQNVVDARAALRNFALEGDVLGKVERAKREKELAESEQALSIFDRKGQSQKVSPDRPHSPEQFDSLATIGGLTQFGGMNTQLSALQDIRESLRVMERCIVNIEREGF